MGADVRPPTRPLAGVTGTAVTGAAGLASAALLLLALALAGPRPAFAAPATTAVAAGDTSRIDGEAWVDHDGATVSRPAYREKSLYAHEFREAVLEPFVHLFDVPDKILWIAKQMGADTDREAVDVNAFDEVPNSTWFTNRNHVRALSTEEVRRGPSGEEPTKPWTITSRKKGGVNPGFRIKDADGRKWQVKLDPPGCPQLGSGADAVVSRLLYAAGYNISHDVSLSFRREDLKIDPELARGKDGDIPFTGEILDSLLAHGARNDDGRVYGQASLLLTGTPVGPINMRGRRRDDPNDRFTHMHRRELRGLYVLMSWVNSWDTKDHQSLEMFEPPKSDRGHVRHYLLDVGASLGAAAAGPKPDPVGFEYTLDWKWIGRRMISLGFAVEPWRGVKQESGIPSVGNFQSAVYRPNRFKMLQPHPAFRLRTERDGYWGAKLVASFSDAQIAAAVEGANYEDPRARDYLVKALVERRDRVARYWFGRVAPVDFFHVEEGELRFHDLAVDRKLEPARAYDVHVRAVEGQVAKEDLHLTGPALPLGELGSAATRVELVIGVAGRDAKPATVELSRRGDLWTVTAVRHA